MTKGQKEKLEKKYNRERKKFFKECMRTGIEASQFRDNFLKENGIEL